MSYKSLTVNIIVAVADNLAIGRDNALLWHISEDLRYFKSVTSGHTVIMGRNTFLSIGRPLPKRRNIVITRDPSVCSLDKVEGIVCANSLEAALEECLSGGDKEVFIIGGGQIYAHAMQYADTLYLTRVHTVIEDADTFFPQIDSSWVSVSQGETMTDAQSGLDFRFDLLRRNR